MNEAEKMREVMNYIMNNVYRPLKLEDVARNLGYRPRGLGEKFVRYFEMPFSTFVSKMRLRRAAHEIYVSRPLKIKGERYGFTSESNFYRAFKKEFGITPKQFRENCALIPDMPCKATINHHPVTMEYKKVDMIEIEGYPIRVEEGRETDLLENVAYVFRHPTSHVDMQCKEPQWGADYYDIARTSRELAQYVFHVWKDLNHKTMDNMAFTYEKFDEHKSYLYIPLLKGMGGIEMDASMQYENVVQKIVKYVDEHILEDLTAESVVAQFKYSDFFCRDRFTSCYNIALPDYIRKKRLYVLAQKFHSGEISEKDITEKYGFRSMRQLRDEFYQEYGVNPENYEEIKVDLVDIPEYYSQNIHRLKTSQIFIDPITIIGKVIKSAANKEEVDLNVPGLAAFWMQNDFPELKKTEYTCPEPGKEDKIVLYETIFGKQGKKDVHNCVLGTVVKESDLKKIPETMHSVTIEGGNYIVFEYDNINTSDTQELTEAIRLIILCIEHRWIYDNWVRTDFHSRVSFFRYHNGKIGYYVPIYG